MRPHLLLTSPVGRVLRWALSLAVLGWLATQVQWAGFRGLREVDWWRATPALLLAALAYPLQAWRWQLLLRAQGLIPSTRWVHGIFWIGQFYNSFLPGGVAGDAVRLAAVWRFAPDRKAAGAASLIADRLLGLGTLCALAAWALGLQLTLAEGTGELRTLLAASVTAAGVLFAGGWAITQTRRWKPLSARLLGTERASALHDAAHALGRQPGLLAGATLLSVAVWLADFASLWLLARALGLDAGPLAMAVAAAAAYLAAALPISIGGHGVREGALLAALALLGVGTAQPATTALLALLVWAVAISASLVGGAVQVVTLVTGRALAPPPADFGRAPDNAPH